MNEYVVLCVQILFSVDTEVRRVALRADRLDVYRLASITKVEARVAPLVDLGIYRIWIAQILRDCVFTEDSSLMVFDRASRTLGPSCPEFR